MVSRLLVRRGRTWQKSFRAYGASPLCRKEVSAAPRQNLHRFRHINGANVADTSGGIQFNISPHVSLFRAATIGAVAASIASITSNENIVADGPPIQTNSKTKVETTSPSPSKGAGSIEHGVQEEEESNSENKSMATNKESEQHRSTLMQVLDLMSKVGED